jgi:hypothetical protein
VFKRSAATNEDLGWIRRTAEWFGGAGFYAELAARELGSNLPNQPRASTLVAELTMHGDSRGESVGELLPSGLNVFEQRHGECHAPRPPRDCTIRLVGRYQKLGRTALRVREALPKLGARTRQCFECLHNAPELGECLRDVG